MLRFSPLFHWMIIDYLLMSFIGSSQLPHILPLITHIIGISFFILLLAAIIIDNISSLLRHWLSFSIIIITPLLPCHYIHYAIYTLYFHIGYCHWYYYIHIFDLLSLIILHADIVLPYYYLAITLLQLMILLLHILITIIISYCHYILITYYWCHWYWCRYFISFSGWLLRLSLIMLPQ